MALVDLGTGAGLGLQLDRYRYRIGTRTFGPAGAGNLNLLLQEALTPYAEGQPERRYGGWPVRHSWSTHASA